MTPAELEGGSSPLPSIRALGALFHPGRASVLPSVPQRCFRTSLWVSAAQRISPKVNCQMRQPGWEGRRNWRCARWEVGGRRASGRGSGVAREQGAVCLPSECRWRTSRWGRRWAGVAASIWQAGAHPADGPCIHRAPSTCQVLCWLVGLCRKPARHSPCPQESHVREGQ